MPKSRIIRDRQARLDPCTDRLPARGPAMSQIALAADPVTDPVPRVPPSPRLDDPDERTPLFDSLWAITGMAGRHALTPTGEAPMGRHVDDDGNGIADWAEQNQRLPHDDGFDLDPYAVADPDEFEEG